MYSEAYSWYELPEVEKKIRQARTRLNTAVMVIRLLLIESRNE